MRAYLSGEKQRMIREPQGVKGFWFILFAGCSMLFATVYIIVSSPVD